MIPPAGYAIAAITVMLWLIWSDTLRQRRGSNAVYLFRALVFLGVTGVFIAQMIQYPYLYRGGGRLLGILAAAVGVLGAAWFVRRVFRRA